MNLSDVAFVDSRKVQEGNGTYLVSVPMDLVKAFDLEKGDQLIFAYDGESDSFEARPLGSSSDR